MLGMMPLRPRRTVDQFAAAIGAAIVERLCAFRAERALEAADERTRRRGGEVSAAALAIGSHV